jgi:hypothetical protein
MAFDQAKRFVNDVAPAPTDVPAFPDWNERETIPEYVALLAALSFATRISEIVAAAAAGASPRRQAHAAIATAARRG